MGAAMSVFGNVVDRPQNQNVIALGAQLPL